MKSTYLLLSAASLAFVTPAYATTTGPGDKDAPVASATKRADEDAVSTGVAG